MDFNGSLRGIWETLWNAIGNWVYQEVELIVGGPCEREDELAQIELFSFWWFKLFQDLRLVSAEEVNNKQEQRLKSISSVSRISKEIWEFGLES